MCRPDRGKAEKSIKKFLCLALAVFMAMTFAGCGTSSAIDTTDEALKALRSYDKEAIKTYWGDGSPFILDETADSFDRLMKAILSGMTYTIKSAEEDDRAGTALVTVDITNSVYEQLLLDSMSEMYSELSHDASLPEDQQLSKSELKSKLIDKSMELLQSGEYEKITTTVDIALLRVNGRWMISWDDAYASAILGCTSSLQDIFD